MKLIYTETGKTVSIGDVVTVSGVAYTVAQVREPQHAASTGRVYVSYGINLEREFFPSVIGAAWVDDVPANELQVALKKFEVWSRMNRQAIEEADNAQWCDMTKEYRNEYADMVNNLLGVTVIALR